MEDAAEEYLISAGIYWKFITAWEGFIWRNS